MDSNLFVIIISYRLTYKATEGKQILLRNTATNATFHRPKIDRKFERNKLMCQSNMYDRDELCE